MFRHGSFLAVGDHFQCQVLRFLEFRCGTSGTQFGRPLLAASQTRGPGRGTGRIGRFSSIGRGLTRIGPPHFLEAGRWANFWLAWPSVRDGARRVGRYGWPITMPGGGARIVLWYEEILSC